MFIELRKQPRRGATLMLAVFLSIVLVGALAFAIDIGFVANSRAEIQRSADSAATAAVWELIPEVGDSDLSEEIASAREYASQYAGNNKIAGSSPAVDLNGNNLPGGGVVVGEYSFEDETWSYDDPDQFNAVQVRVRRNASQNGELPLFFARLFGKFSMPTEAVAMAGLQKGFSGFSTPASGTTLGFLPITLDEDTWNDLMAGAGQDSLRWDSVDEEVEGGSDGILEVSLYPENTGSPGNRGTVNVGGSSNSTSRVSRQIEHGLNQSDLDYHGGAIQLDENGELVLGADPGISAGFKDELQAIVGETRILPIFSDLTGNGNNAKYTIVRFVGVRIMEVKLTGQNKRVIIQPANVIVPATSAVTSETSSSSTYLVSSPLLIE